MEQEIKNEFETLTHIVKSGFDDLEGRMAEKFEDIEGRMATKDDLRDLESRMNIRFDEIDQRLARFEVELKDVKETLRRLEKRVTEDTDALAGEVDNLRERVAVLEKKFNQLQSSAV